MDLKFLMSLGAEVVCGHVTIRHTVVGSLLADGTVLLTPDGEQYVNELRTVDEPPRTVKVGRRKAEDPAES